MNDSLSVGKAFISCIAERDVMIQEMPFQSGKTLAKIGSFFLLLPISLGGILNLTLPFPYINIVGLILLLIGIQSFSEYYRDESLSRNALYGTILGIVAGIFEIFFPSTLITFNLAIIATDLISLSAWIVAVIFLVFEAFYFKRVFDNLAGRSGGKLFRYGGLLLLIGSVFTIILIGFALEYVAWAIITAAFFLITPNPQRQTAQPQSLSTES